MPHAECSLFLLCNYSTPHTQAFVARAHFLIILMPFSNPTTFDAGGTDWSLTQEFIIPRDFQLIALRARAYNDGDAAGILLSIPLLGIVSGTAWRCVAYDEVASGPATWRTADYDDTEWSPAASKGYNGDSPWGALFTSAYAAPPRPLRHLNTAQWIWLPALPGQAPQLEIACRMRRAPDGGNDSGNVSDSGGGGDSGGSDVKLLPADGDHMLMVIAEDALGNRQAVASVASWTSDTTPPVVELTQTPTTGDIQQKTGLVRVTTSQAVFDFRQDAASAPATPQFVGGYRVSSKFRLALNGKRMPGYYCERGSFMCYGFCREAPQCVQIGDTTAAITSECNTILQGCDKGKHSTPLILLGLHHAAHSLSLMAIDPAGNVGPTTVFSWFIDNQRPAVVILGHPRGHVYPMGPSNALEYVFEYAAEETRSTFFECVSSLQCALHSDFPGSGSEASANGGWADCTSNREDLCRGRIVGELFLYHTTQLISQEISGAVKTMLLASLHVTLREVQYRDIAVTLAGEATVYPFQKAAMEGEMYVAAEDEIVHADFNVSLEECFAQCTELLHCRAVRYNHAKPECLGLTGTMTAEPTSADDEVEYFARIGKQRLGWRAD